MPDYTEYSTNPAENNKPPPVGAPEGMMPSAVNDVMRYMMAVIRTLGDTVASLASSIANKTDKSYVDAQVATRATTAALNNGLAGKRDKSDGAFNVAISGTTASFTGNVNAPNIGTMGARNAYSSTSPPSINIGVDGDIYLQY